MLVPARFLPTIIAELALSGDRLAIIGNPAAPNGPQFGTDGSYPRPGWLLVYVKALPDSRGRYTFLDVDSPTTFGRIRLVPISIVGREAWLFRIDPAPT